MTDSQTDSLAAREMTYDDAATLPPLAFVHIPKTAGTSITNVLRNIYGVQACPATTTLDYRKLDSAALGAYRFFSGHAYRRDYERLPAGISYFTVLRDPVARTLSTYRYYRQIDETHLNDDFMLEASRLAKSDSAIAFIYSDSPFIIEHIRLGQLRQFLTPETLMRIAHRQFLTRDLRRRAIDEFQQEMTRFDYVLTCESLALTFPLMTARLGLPMAGRALGRDNRSFACDNIEPDDIRRAVMDVNEAEFSCYEYARRRETAWMAAALTPCCDGDGIPPRRGKPV